MEKQASQNQNQPDANQPAPQAPKVDASDVEKNKIMAIVGYIIPILFFVPLLNDESKKSPFAKFHANQQLNLLLFCILGSIALKIISVILLITIILAILIPLLGIAYMVFVIYLIVTGALGANKGEMKKLPVIGEFELIK